MNKQPTILPDRVVTPLPLRRKPCSTIAIDFAGPFPRYNKKALILVVLNRITVFTYLLTVSQNITAVQTANLLIERIFSVHDFPTSIISDRDHKFTSRSWMQFMANIKIDLNMATAYHHQTYDQTGHTIRTRRPCRRNLVNPKGTKWTRHLLHVQTAINAAPGNSSELSPFEITSRRIITASLVSKSSLPLSPLLMT